MSIENAQTIDQLDAANPPDSANKAEGAGHIRAIKTAAKGTFPNLVGSTTVTKRLLDGLGVNQPLGTNNDLPASTAHLQQALLNQTVNAQLPGQSGNAGRFLGTNGTQAAWLPPLVAGRNLLINGNFAINQDKRTGTVTLPANSYGHDGWVAGAAGCTYDFTTTGLDTVVNITAGSLCQRVDPLNVEGGSYVLSWTGTAGGRLLGQATYSATGLVLTGLAAATMHTLEFGVGTLGLVQFERGTLPTPYERLKFKDALVDCQRYYRRGKTPSLVAYGVPANDVGRFQLSLNPPMRAAPTFSLNAPPTYSANVSGNLGMDSSSPDFVTLKLMAAATGGVYCGADGEFALGARL